MNWKWKIGWIEKQRSKKWSLPLEDNFDYEKENKNQPSLFEFGYTKKERDRES